MMAMKVFFGVLCLVPIGIAEESVGTVIGIDLGTTYSCVGVYKNGQVEIIPNDQGNRITPSYVAFTPDGNRLIGDAAMNQLTSNSENTIFDVKRMIGKSWDDETLQKDIKNWPFTVKEKKNKPYVQVKVKGVETLFAPEEISAMVLSLMRTIAEDYLDTRITHAVITVPAYFNDAQRQATKDAGTIAGLNVLRILNEPTAAALAYGLDKKLDSQTILVFDLGGGIFDVSTLIIADGVFQMIATTGDAHLGGQDFNQRVMDHFASLYHSKTGIDIRADTRAMQKLRREVERAKRVLSVAHETKLEIDSFYKGKDFYGTLTRAKFEELNIDLFKSTMQPVGNVLKDSHLAKEDVDEIVLVGGSTRIPKVQQLVKEFFAGKAPNKGINPDEAVAYGAAVQAGILMGSDRSSEVLPLDVNPRSLGIETKGDLMDVIIPRYLIIPTKRIKIYSTAKDNQDNVHIQVYEGERPENHLLGKFSLTGIPPAPRGVPQIEVTFKIDINGILHVTARDKGTGNKEHVTINSEKRYSNEEIERMVKDAKKYRMKDKMMKRKIEAFNELEKFIYTVRHTIHDTTKLGSKISDEDRKTIDKALDKCEVWIKYNPEAERQEVIVYKAQLELLIEPIISKLTSEHMQHDEM